MADPNMGSVWNKYRDQWLAGAAEDPKEVKKLYKDKVLPPASLDNLHATGQTMGKVLNTLRELQVTDADDDINKRPELLAGIIPEEVRRLVSQGAPSQVSAYREQLKGYATAAEDFWFQNRAGVPVHFLADMGISDFSLLTPQDVEYLAPEYTDIYQAYLTRYNTVMEDAERLAQDQLKRQQAAAAAGAEFFSTATPGLVLKEDGQLDVDAELEALIQANAKRIWEQMYYELQGLPVPDDFEPEIGEAGRSLGSVISSNAWVRRHIIQPHVSAGRLLKMGWENWHIPNPVGAIRATLHLAGGAINVIGEAIGQGPMRGEPDPVTGRRPILFQGDEGYISIGERERNKAVEAMRAEYEAAMPFQVDLVLAAMADAQLESLEQQHPEVAAELIQVNGGNRTSAAMQLETMGLFGGGDGMDNKRQVVPDYFDQQFETIVKEMSADDYKLTTRMMDKLAAYGKYVVGSIATGAVLLYVSAFDGSRRDEIWDRGFASFWGEIEKSDYRPSVAAGLDGTGMGLFMDIGLTVAADPTVWFFGRPGAIINPFRNQTAVTRWLRSYRGQWAFDEAVEVTRRSLAVDLPEAPMLLGKYNITRGMPNNFRFKFFRSVQEGDAATARVVWDEAILSGWVPNNADRAMRSTFFMRHLSATIRNSAFGKSHRYWFTKQNLNTTFTLYGPTALDDIADTVLRLVGEDGALAASFETRLWRIMEESTNVSDAQIRVLVEDSNRLAEEYELYQAIADGVVRPNAEKFVVGGREFASVEEIASDLRLRADQIDLEVSSASEELGGVQQLSGADMLNPVDELLGSAAGRAPDFGDSTVYHGSRVSAAELGSFVDDSGNLTLRSSSNFGDRMSGVSFTNDLDEADHYRKFVFGDRTTEEGIIFSIDSSALPDLQQMNDTEVLAALEAGESVTIPAGRWKAYADLDAVNASLLELREFRTSVAGMSDDVLVSRFVDDLLAKERREWSGADMDPETYAIAGKRGYFDRDDAFGEVLDGEIAKRAMRPGGRESLVSSLDAALDQIPGAAQFIDAQSFDQTISRMLAHRPRGGASPDAARLRTMADRVDESQQELLNYWPEERWAELGPALQSRATFVQKYGGAELDSINPTSAANLDQAHLSGAGVFVDAAPALELGVEPWIISYVTNSDGLSLAGAMPPGEGMGPAVWLSREVYENPHLLPGHLDRLIAEIPELTKGSLAQLVASGRIQLTDELAEVMHGYLTKKAVLAAQGNVTRRWMADLVPKMRRVEATAHEANKLTPRQRIRDLVIETLEEYVKTNTNLRRIRGLVEIVKSGPNKGERVINWEVLRPINRRNPGTLQETVDRGAPGVQIAPTGIAEDLVAFGNSDSVYGAVMRHMLHPLSESMHLNLPVSLLDIKAAEAFIVKAFRNSASRAEANKRWTADWAKYRLEQMAVKTSEFFNFFHNVFVLDKVLRPATGLVVHADEMIRYFHRYGLEGVRRWTADFAAKRVMNVQKLLHHVGKLDGRLPPKIVARARARLEASAEAIPRQYQEAQRSLFRKSGDFNSNLTNTDAGFHTAAQQWSNWFLQDEGFRAAITDDAAWVGGSLSDQVPLRFREFWEDNSSMYLRSMSGLDFGSGVNRSMTMTEAYGFYRNMFEGILAKAGPSRREMVIAAWRGAANKISAGGRAVELPKSALNALDGIPGWTPKGTSKFTDTINTLGDKIFLGPMNYRQGLIARTERLLETKRLEELFTSRGIQIVDHDEFVRIAQRMGIWESPRLNPIMGSYVDEQMMQMGLVSRNYIETMAEQAASKQIESLMYSWHLGTPAGRAVKHIAPFGKPWAEMWGHWNKQLFSHATLRMGPEHYGKVAAALDTALSTLPFNPRTFGFLSRTANIEFDLDRPFGDDGLSIRYPWSRNENFPDWVNEAGGFLRTVFGEGFDIASLDLGAILFLPTADSNPAISFIPGLGWIPMTLLDWYVPKAGEEVDEDSFRGKIAAWVRDNIADFLPYYAYGEQGALSRFVGGGWIGVGTSMVRDFQYRQTGVYRSFFLTDTHDVNSRVQTIRLIGGMMAEDEFWEELWSWNGLPSGEDFGGLSSEDFIAAQFTEMLREASTEATANTMTARAMRQIVPIVFGLDSSYEDVAQIWLGAARRFPAEFGLQDVDIDFIEEEDPQALIGLLRDIRTSFYAMDRHQADLLVLQYRGLARHRIASWTWNLSMREAEGAPDMLLPYRSQAGDKGTEEFQNYKARGFIIPKSGEQVMMGAVGEVFAVQDRLTKAIYEQAAGWINEQYLRLAAEREGGYDPATFDWDTWRSIGGEEWSTRWIHNSDPDKFSERFREFVFTLPLEALSPDMAVLVENLDIDLGDTYTGQQLIEALQTKLGNNATHPLSIYSKLARNVDQGTNLTRNDLYAALLSLDNSDVSALGPSGLARDFVHMAQSLDENRENLLEENKDDPFYTDDDVNEELFDDIAAVRNTYAVMVHISPHTQQWKWLWDSTMAYTYGPYPVDWEPPAPPGMDMDIHPRDLPGAYRPFVLNVIDGDSIEINTSGPTGPFGSAPVVREIRLIGVKAQEYEDENRRDQAEQQHRDLYRALVAAPPGSIWLVRDPDRFREVDDYGRELAWLWIDGEWYWFPDTLVPGDF